MSDPSAWFRALRERSPLPLPWFGAAPLAVYGAGAFGRSIAASLQARGVNVSFFIDRAAKPGARVDGVPVLAPGDVPASDWPSLVVLVALHNPVHPVTRTLDDLEARGCRHLLAPVEIADRFGDAFGIRYWLTAPAWYLPAEETILATRASFDPESRALFDRVLAHRLTGDYRALPEPTHAVDDYMPAELGGPTGPLRMIDGGAYDGDTPRTLLGRGQPLEAVAAFEPDPLNFDRLADWAGKQRGFEVLLWPCGLHSQATQLAFSAGQGESSALSSDGDIRVQCVAVDEVLPSFRPNFIKLDIEGAEVTAILGARRTIAEHRPHLSIALYHHPAHFWQIPRLVKSIVPDYGLHLRLHAQNGFELRLYATPPGR